MKVCIRKISKGSKSNNNFIQQYHTLYDIKWIKINLLLEKLISFKKNPQRNSWREEEEEEKEEEEEEKDKPNKIF